jgi:hypothetical protein
LRGHPTITAAATARRPAVATAKAAAAAETATAEAAAPVAAATAAKAITASEPAFRERIETVFADAIPLVATLAATSSVETHVP